MTELVLFTFLIVSTEKLYIIDALNLQYTTKYFFGKRHIHLPIDCIHDVIINEVIFGVSLKLIIYIFICLNFSILCLLILQFRTIYVLQVLTKGAQFEKRPVVPLLEVCFSFVYSKNINKSLII